MMKYIYCSRFPRNYIWIDDLFLLSIDVNECSNVPSVCHKNASCTNSEGSYSCQCKSGYSGDGKINCTGITEINSPL